MRLIGLFMVIHRIEGSVSFCERVIIRENRLTQAKGIDPTRPGFVRRGDLPVIRTSGKQNGFQKGWYRG